MVTYEEFSRIDLRTAVVVEARVHPHADRLLVLEVDLGEMGRRQIVAGIRPWYAPEALEGKTVLVVANLEPARLRGEESRGMLLAVQDGEDVRIVTTDVPVGGGLAVI